ncbi:hypothetical protein ACXJJ3_25880 [Kribbella sp. WER1]
MTQQASTRLELRNPLPEDLAQELERRLLFLSPEIVGFELHCRDGQVHSLTLTTMGTPDMDRLSAKVDTVVDREIRQQTEAPSKRIWESPHSRTADSGVYQQLLERDIVSEQGEGQVAIGEPLLSLLNWFDHRFRGMLDAAFDVTEYRYPTLISTRALERAGYPGSFPQHLMLVTRLHNDLDTYREFTDRLADGPIDAAVLEHCRNIDYCLPPTMCYHTFHQYRGRTLEPDGLKVVTCRGKSFRYEAGYATTLERLWDFTIREVVFLGTRHEVLDARECYLAEILAFTEELGLAGHCEVANDPFFGGVDSSARISSQRMLELKYEVRLDVGDGRDIACASFNFHDALFGKAFDIQLDDSGPIRTGCVGFGLERWVYAFLCRYGADPADWPSAVGFGPAGRGLPEDRFAGRDSRRGAVQGWL